MIYDIMCIAALVIGISDRNKKFGRMEISILFINACVRKHFDVDMISAEGLLEKVAISAVE